MLLNKQTTVSGKCFQSTVHSDCSISCSLYDRLYLERRELASGHRYLKEGRYLEVYIHQYQCDNPFII